MFLYKEPWLAIIYILNAFHNKTKIRLTIVLNTDIRT